jgi:hypothetical protein
VIRQRNQRRSTFSSCKNDGSNNQLKIPVGRFGMIDDAKELISHFYNDPKMSDDGNLMNFKLIVPPFTTPLPEYMYDTDLGLEHNLSILEKNSPSEDENNFVGKISSKIISPTFIAGKRVKIFCFPLPPTPKIRKKFDLSIHLSHNSDSSIEEIDSRC